MRVRVRWLGLAWPVRVRVRGLAWPVRVRVRVLHLGINPLPGIWEKILPNPGE